MADYLPPGMRCTGFWYAQRAGMLPYGGPADPDDRAFLAELGLQAARLARWHGIPERKILEGPYWVHSWPEHIWGEVANRIAQQAADHGEYYLDARPPARVVHCQREPCDVYIGRPGPWGNPFVTGRDGTREQVIAMYETYLRSRADLMAEVPGLRGKVLGCWCAPLPCHGDVLARIADETPDRSGDPPGHGYRSGSDGDEVIPPRVPLPQGRQALADAGY